MSNINSTDRSNFFPHSKTKNSGSVNKSQLPSRNDTRKANELKGQTGIHAKVEIPEHIKDFARIKSAVDQAPPLDNSAKIQALRDKISSGNYKVDYDAIADKILNEIS